jgi:hypothetical protein
MLPTQTGVALPCWCRDSIHNFFMAFSCGKKTIEQIFILKKAINDCEIDSIWGEKTPLDVNVILAIEFDSAGCCWCVLVLP